MKLIFLFSMILATLTLLSCTTKTGIDNATEPNDFSNDVSKDRMLLVLSAPSVHNNYYKPAFEKIVAFQINYAKKILGNDNVVVIVDKDTKRFYEGNLPEDVLLTAEVFDIWVRDFTTVNPLEPTQLVYTWASMSKKQSEETQQSFVDFADKYDLKRNHSDLKIDGGNIVDNYAGNYITTTRFAEDNKLSKSQAKEKLKQTLKAKSVAILEPDEEVLAHSDGMVMWLNEKTLLVNQYTDKAFRKLVLDELHASFPDVKIIEVPVEYGKNKKGEWEGFESACGVNLNSVLTFKNIYVPVFGMNHDAEAIKIIKQNTDKNVIEVDAKSVCAMGGSVRCLTWQLTGDNAEKLIKAAKEN